MEKHLINELADFLQNIKFSDLSANTVEKTKWVILDALGCGIAGSNDKAIETLKKTLIQSKEFGSSPVFCTKEKFSVSASIFIMGSMICALDLDDTHSFSSVHAAGPIISAALSTAGVCPANKQGETFIEAVVAGYEVACRIGMSIRGKNPYDRGFHPTGICGVFGAAAAVVKMLGLDQKKCIHALGIAGSQAGGLMSYLQNGAWTKKLHSGLSGRAGFTAASLAANDFLGPNDIFQGKYGFPNGYSNIFEPEKLVERLGSQYEIGRMSFKRYACCRTIQAPITAALELFNKGEYFLPEAITEIKAIIADEDLGLVLEPIEKKKNPQSVVEAQFSMPFSLATFIVYKEITIPIYQKALSNPLVKKISNLFRYEINNNYTELRPNFFPCNVKIALSGGRTLSHSIQAPLGDYQNPLPQEQHEQKIRELTGLKIGKVKTGELLKTILKIEHLPMSVIPELINQISEAHTASG